MKVLVLCGGESPERIVSLASGDAVGKWIEQAGHDVRKYDPEVHGKLLRASDIMAPPSIGLAPPTGITRTGYSPTTVRELLRVIDEFQPDMIFPILHGGRGEDGSLQSLLEWVGVPFAGSGSLACGVAMHKELTRMIMRASGVPVTAGFVVPRDKAEKVEYISSIIDDSFGYPVVIKPLRGGSTVGLSKVFVADQIGEAIRAIDGLGDDILVEAHFSGRELAATIVAGEAFPLVEIKPKEGFYDYSNKYTSGRSDYICPAELSEETTLAIQCAAEKVFFAAGCRGFSRLDFLLNDDGEFVCLEINTLPGMTTNSLVPKAARQRGIQSPELMQMIMNCSLPHAAK